MGFKAVLRFFSLLQEMMNVLFHVFISKTTLCTVEEYESTAFSLFSLPYQKMIAN